MKISIITVVYNSKNTIKETIESVLHQDYPLIEYIIIDGQSNDGTLDIIKMYKDKISKLISEKDNGIYDAMNKGIKLANGDIIGILNSDDIFENNKVISKVVKIFKTNSINSLYADLKYVNRYDTDKIIRYWKSSPFIKNSFKNGWHPPHPTFFVKKEIYEKYGYYNLNFKISADFELMLRFLERYNISTYYLPESIIKMRIGGKSNMNIFNILLGNINCYKAFKFNNVNISLFYPFFRFASKIKQFFVKK
ncbi:MAG: glycosyltransferase [Spirochaetes bacterium]|nr:glycosyltransferase [Spirochaetota bacterium]